jgi:L-fucose mutarotase
MLKGIPGILPPDLLKFMMEMGHGDELVIADGNYPCLGHPSRIARCDGHGIPEVLDAILRFFPLDSYVEHPVIFMEVLPNDPYIPVIWEQYRDIIKKHEGKTGLELPVNKFDFYKRGAQAYAVVTTGEKSGYANIIIKKGVVKQ